MKAFTAGFALLLSVNLGLLSGCNDSASSTESQAEMQRSETTDVHSIKPAAFYSIATYDKEADPSSDLDMTMEKAQKDSKRILLQAGGDWCRWCKLIEKFMTHNSEVRELLEENYLVMKVASKSDNGKSFLADYPEIPGYPHFFVLNSDGDLLHSQPTAALEQGEGYDEELFLNFLKEWLPDSSAETEPKS